MKYILFVTLNLIQGLKKGWVYFVRRRPSTSLWALARQGDCCASGNPAASVIMG